ncbi:MAG TPA: MarR family winged helix-turn-helix transcriptional regulator [Actinomycetota bacterium]|nr:MarR family winged helix-turn-helix transcriptional regulator [Actinomycetota bacterium]
MTRKLSDREYERLLEFRTAVRRFLAWSRSQAANAGIAPTQHQLLLAIRGHRDHSRGPTIGETAEYLLLKPNSVVELVDRASAAGLVERVPDGTDQRVVRLRLTPTGESKLNSISAATLDQLDEMAPHLQAVQRVLGTDGDERS